jgi:acyl carrier protein
VDAAAEGRVVGHIGLYNCDRISGVASVAAYFDQRLPSAELVAAAAIRDFLDYVFEVVGLRKIHVEMPVANLGTLSQIVERLGVARIEGVFKAHTKIGPEYHDMQQMAVWADDYRQFRKREGLASHSNDGGGELFSQLCMILYEMGYGPAETISGGTRLIDDLGLDSLALVEVMVEFEQVVGRDLDWSDIGAGVCMQDLVELSEAASAGARFGDLPPDT